jgi:hypothetical protein
MAYKNKDGVWIDRDTIECDRYEFDTTAEKLKAYIDSIVDAATAKGMVGEGTFDFDLNTGWHSDCCELTVKYGFERFENDKERSAREAEVAKVKAAAAAKRKAAAEKKKLAKDAEYAEFLRLKEKFGAL